MFRTPSLGPKQHAFINSGGPLNRHGWLYNAIMALQFLYYFLWFTHIKAMI